MGMLGRSVHLTSLFSWASLTKRLTSIWLTSTSNTYFRLGVHLGFIISPFLSTIMIGVLFSVFPTDSPYLLLYADNQKIIAGWGIEVMDGDEMRACKDGYVKHSGVWHGSGTAKVVWIGPCAICITRTGI